MSYWWSRGRWIADAIRARVLTPGHRCISEETLIAFYLAAAEDADAARTRDSIAECRQCLKAARDAQTFMASLDEQSAANLVRLPAQPAGVRAHARSAFPALLAAAAAIIAVVLAAQWWIGSRQGPEPEQIAGSTRPPVASNPWQDLQIPKAAFVPAPRDAGDEIIWRSEPAAPPPEDAFARAMGPYQRGELADAERSLSEYIASDPSDLRARFYLGVTLALLGRTEEARGLFEAAARAEQVELRDHALWYLALVELKLGETAAARTLLDGLRGGGHRAAEAAEKLAEIDRLASPTR